MWAQFPACVPRLPLLPVGGEVPRLHVAADGQRELQRPPRGAADKQLCQQLHWTEHVRIGTSAVGRKQLVLALPESGARRARNRNTARHEQHPRQPLGVGLSSKPNAQHSLWAMHTEGEVPLS